MVNFSVMIGFFIYLAGMLFLGIYLAKFNKTNEDFLLGGRKLSSWVLALSERASGESAWLLLGMTGAAMTVGFGEIWTALGCILGILFSWFFIAGPLRGAVGLSESLTIPDYFSEKFDDGGFSVRLISTLVIILAYFFYVAAQFNGAGKVLNVTFGIPQFWGIVIGASVIILYTMLGGFFAVAWTDVVQGIIMFLTLIILPIIGFIEIAQTNANILAPMQEAGQHLTSFLSGKTGWAAIAFVLGGLSWGFGYMGQPHLLIRFLALKNEKEAKKGRIVAAAWTIPAFIGAFLIGIVGIGLHGSTTFLDDPEKLLPTLAIDLLPLLIAGIFISGAIAAMMSTADSQLIVMTSSLTEDIMTKLLNMKLSQKQLVMWSRVFTVILGVASFIFAVFAKELVFNIVSYAWSILGAGMGPVILLSLYWKKLTKAGVLTSLITGTLATLIWKNVAGLEGLISHRFAAFVISITLTIIVSILTAKKSKVEA